MREPLRIALGQGRIFDKTRSLFARAGIDLTSIDSDPRRLIHPIEIAGIERAEALLVRSADVGAYVEHGVCALGVTGYDTIAEQRPNVLVPLDLKIGVCRLALSSRPEVEPLRLETPRIASKYPRLASRYFLERGASAEIIALSGAIELAPLVGLADAIVDIVESGQTLARNGLVEKATILEVSARLVVNRAALKLRTAEIRIIEHALHQVVDAGAPLAASMEQTT